MDILSHRESIDKPNSSKNESGKPILSVSSPNNSGSMISNSTYGSLLAVDVNDGK